MSTSVRRLEDQRFVTGTGTFIDDVSLDGQTHAAVLRSSRAHARIVSIDASGARAAPGVLLIVTGKDWVAAGHSPIPTKTTVRTKRDGSPFNEPKRHCLAVDTVRHVGEPVALVVAETQAEAEAALELIEVDYVELPAVAHQRAALGEGAPQLWAEAPGNLCLDFELGNRAAVEEAFARADHVVSLDIANNRVAVAPLETRCALARYDAASDRYFLHTPSQGVFFIRDCLAEQVFHIRAEQLDVVTGDVGGAFGMKIVPYPEHACVLWAAKVIGRPVLWVSERSE